jgi:hypothetical protein
MAAENFDIVFRVIGGKVASAEMASVAKGSEEVGAAQVAASAKGESASKSMVKQAAVLGGLYAGYKLLKGSVSTTVELTRNTLAFQRATGLDMKTAQAWVVTAQHRDISVKQLQQSMGTLGRALGATTKPTKASAYAFKTLGVSFTKLKAESPEQRMATLANAFHKLPNGIDKAALAQKLFGRAGQGLLPILNLGAKGMNDQLEEAKKLVPPVAKNAAAAGNLMKQQRALNAMMTGLEVTIGSALIPILSGLMRVLGPIAGVFTTAMSHSELFRAGVYTLSAALLGLMVYSKLLVPILKALGLSELIAEAPIGIWVVGIAALAAAFYLAYTHIKVFRDAVNAAVNWLKNWHNIVLIAASVLLGPLGTAIVLAIEHFNSIKTAVMSVVNKVRSVFNSMIAFVKGIPGRVAGAVMGVFHTIASTATNIVARVRSTFSAMVGFFKGLPGRITSAVSGVWNGFLSAAQSVIGKILSAFSNLVSSIISKIGSIPVVGGLFKDAVNLVTGGGSGGSPNAGAGANQAKHGKALGGLITQTGSYLVGEKGPEIVTLTKGEKVIPNHQLTGALSGMGGGGGGTINVPVYLDRKQIALAVARYAGDQQKRR